jgi:hypothetical protein
MKSCSRHGMRSGASTAKTASGRARKASAAASAIPFSAVGTSRDGNTSRPSITNIRIWASQASASCTRRMPVLYGIGPAASRMAAR